MSRTEGARSDVRGRPPPPASRGRRLPRDLHLGRLARRAPRTRSTRTRGPEASCACAGGCRRQGRMRRALARGRPRARHRRLLEGAMRTSAAPSARTPRGRSGMQADAGGR
eukprot:Amastigsp_a511382_14.p5 type:complete len:111 gc:universal Amastigsp_a511382_14:486-818(+)